MARGVQLVQLVKDVRMECGHSTNVAQSPSTRETIQYLLRRTQEELFEAHEWPQLHVYRDVELHAGDRFYDFPVNFSFEHVMRMHTQIGSEWVPVCYGIGDAQYSVYTDERAEPVQRWGFSPDQSQFEVWPVPPRDGAKVRIWGTKALDPLIEESDRCTLDSNLLVLFVAAEVLARQKSEDAQLKLQKGQELLRRLKTRSISNKTGTIVLGGVDPYASRKKWRPGFDYIPRGR